MQDPNKPSQPRNKVPWYKKAVEMATLWKALAKPTEIPSPNATIWKTISKTSTTDLTTTSNSTNNNKKLKKCTSLKLSTSFTRVCLCVPFSSYSQVFQAEVVPPRRSFSYPPSRSSSSRPPSLPLVQEPRAPSGRLTTEGRKIFRSRPLTSLPLVQEPGTVSGRLSTEGTKIFRGKSLTEDVLMRRFVVEENEAMMQVRKRNEMEIIRKRCAIRRRRLGPSPLCRMILYEEEE